MKKETETYLIKRIKDLENQVAFYKGFYDGSLANGKPFKREDFKESFTQDDLNKCLAKPTSIFCKLEKDMKTVVIKAKAFNELTKMLHISIGGNAQSGEFYIKTPKHAEEYFINMPIDEKTFSLFVEAMTR